MPFRCAMRLRWILPIVLLGSAGCAEEIPPLDPAQIDLVQRLIATRLEVAEALRAVEDADSARETIERIKTTFKEMNDLNLELARIPRDTRARLQLKFRDEMNGAMDRIYDEMGRMAELSEPEAREIVVRAMASGKPLGGMEPGRVPAKNATAKERND